jgi:methionine biosynthesis protein MetW
MSTEAKNRKDYQTILKLIEPKSKILDLGCGDGDLLSLLMKENSCRCHGIEIDEKAIFKCIQHGVTVSQGDIDSGLQDYSDKRFDYVILNESLQQVLSPERVILEALRVGKRVIVGIPNFCTISARIQVFFGGQVPVTKWLPYKWYNTPNLRFLSIKDFENFCREKGITVEKQIGLTQDKQVSFLPNLFASVGIFVLSKG